MTCKGSSWWRKQGPLLPLRLHQRHTSAETVSLTLQTISLLPGARALGYGCHGVDIEDENNGQNSLSGRGGRKATGLLSIGQSLHCPGTELAF